MKKLLLILSIFFLMSCDKDDKSSSLNKSKKDSLVSPSLTQFTTSIQLFTINVVNSSTVADNYSYARIAVKTTTTTKPLPITLIADHGSFYK